jgi:hypothetical protein
MIALTLNVLFDTIVLSACGIVLIDKIFGTSKSCGDNVERWCHVMMFQATTLAIALGAFAAWLSAFWFSYTAFPAYIALVVFGVMFNLLTLLLRPNEDNLVLWNPHNFRHVFISSLAGFAAGCLLVATPSEFLPLAFGIGATLLSVFVCFICVL